jgi:hypothetical protein
MFSQEDLNILTGKGISLPAAEKQLEQFRKGFPSIRLLRPATPGDGILLPDPKLGERYRKLYCEKCTSLRTVKFVPASGAASRMFKHLFGFLDKHADGKIPSPVRSVGDESDPVMQFASNLEKFAFYRDLEEALKLQLLDISSLRDSGDLAPILRALLLQPGLNYSNLPKALIKFHRYPNGARTAMEEHLVEAAYYVRRKGDIASVHFTLSPEHTGLFDKKLAEVRKKLERDLGITYSISHSVQKPSTDTLAVDMENQPFRVSGQLLFRPAGHGALLENLGDIDADMVFIKNIDNVVPDRLRQPTYDYKMILGGIMLDAMDRIREFMAAAGDNRLTAGDLQLMIKFASEELNIRFSEGFEGFPEEVQIATLREKLNRPIRVCGMVKNEGEPGGGPFWVDDGDGNCSLQIVESSQVDMTDPRQKALFGSSTHFNPVDIVCTTRDYRSRPFDLKDFVDENTGFISVKSSGGRDLKALELPGLWNGSMAKWITVFAEVPVATFNPVKIVNDLLRQEHQS